MKRMTIMAIMALLFLSGCAGWTYNGLTAEDIKEPSWGMAAGFAATYAVHCIGHLATAEIMGYDWHMEGVSEIIDGEMNPTEKTIFAMAGFAIQIAAGYFMGDSEFGRGFKTGTAFHVVTYPLINPVLNGNGDDIEMAENGMLFWGGAAVLAVDQLYW
jgi:hypothetical protein